MPANYLNSTHSESIFVQKLLIILHTGLGRKVLFGDSFKGYSKGALVQEYKMEPDNLKKILSSYLA